METAVTVPDSVYNEVERLAQRLRRSRSQLYTEALIEFIARHHAESVTERMNKVVDEVGGDMDPWLAEAGRRTTLESTEW